MAVTVEQFLVEYPEFAPLYVEDEPLVEAVVARADRRVSPSWPADTRDDIVYAQAADTLARSPMGRNARLSEKDGETSYAQDLKERKKAHAFARSRVV